MANNLSCVNKTRGILRPIILVVMVGCMASSTLFITGCDNYPAEIKGDITQNIPPKVEFSNVPEDGETFSFAPVIHWKGSDKDGFVEFYEYADIVDSTALDAPEYFVDFIPDEAWVMTNATSETVYLLTEAGDTTGHVFYLKCTDDKGLESSVIFQKFFRTNKPPDVPKIKWWDAPDTTYANDINVNKLVRGIVGNDTVFYDTLFTLENLTDTWNGLGFTWKSTDPDDKDLYTIPLQYRYYLEKVPNDTIHEWVATNWSRDQDVNFYGLESGHYKFSVWVRDDGLELCSRPATAVFDVYQPTFEQSILLVNTTDENLDPDSRSNKFRWNLIPGTPIGELYREMASDYADAEYYYHTADSDQKLWKSFLGRFRLVIWFTENQGKTIGSTFTNSLSEYINVGGRLWVLGVLTQGNGSVSATILRQTGESAWAGDASRIPSSDLAEFVGGISGVSDLPDLQIDTAKCAFIYNDRFILNDEMTYGIYPLLGGVDVMTAGADVEAAYYFASYTDTASGDILNDIAQVKAAVEVRDSEMRDWVAIYYPPTPVDCIIALSRNRVLEISRVENITRGVFAEVETIRNNVRNVGSTKFYTLSKVSYPYGEPWALTDSIEVDYRFQPFSERHLRPCAIRYEKLSPAEARGFEVRYRVAIFAFPLYYLDNSNGQVSEMFRSMLNWFFLPHAH